MYWSLWILQWVKKHRTADNTGTQSFMNVHYIICLVRRSVSHDTKKYIFKTFLDLIHDCPYFLPWFALLLMDVIIIVFRTRVVKNTEKVWRRRGLCTWVHQRMKEVPPFRAQRSFIPVNTWANGWNLIGKIILINIYWILIINRVMAFQIWFLI